MLGFAGGGVAPVAVGVYEAGCDGFVRYLESGIGDDRLFADRLFDDGGPLFPLVWALWFPVGVQK
jgi:hypothetical protein